MTPNIQEQFQARGVAQVIVVLEAPGRRTAAAAAAAPGAGAADAAALGKHFVSSDLSQDSALARALASGPPRGEGLARAEAAPGTAPAAPKVRVFPHLGVLLGNVDRKGLAAL